MSEYWSVWTEPRHRPKATLRPGDVAEAIRWYEQETGQKAGAIRLHKSLVDVFEIPEGIEVRYSGGTASCTIQVADSVPVPRGSGE
jgi:hypothetical protein